MKCVKATALLFATCLMFAGCASSKVKESVEASADTYVSEESDVIEETSEVTNKSTKKTTSTKKKKSFNLGDIFKSKFVPIGESSVYSTMVFGGIKQQAAQIVYYPSRELSGFGSAYMAAYYYLTFDDKARHEFINAVDQYFKDFDNKKLKRDDKKSFKVYGSVKTKAYWGTIKTSSPNNGEGKLELGYKFVDKNPYFSLTMQPVINQTFLDGGSEVEESLQLHYYMTKNQCRMLADALSDEALAKAIYEYEVSEYGVPEVEDSYTDDGYEEVEEIE